MEAIFALYLSTRLRTSISLLIDFIELCYLSLFFIITRPIFTDSNWVIGNVLHYMLHKSFVQNACYTP